MKVELSPREIQLRARDDRYALIDALYPRPVNSGDGYYPDPIVCKIASGYYFLPVTPSPVVIDKHGKLFNLHTRKEHPVRETSKGYLVTTLRTERVRVDGKVIFRNFAVHRLVASLFVARPEHLAQTDFNLLQVNHKDGNKKNNAVENLEWVTNDENMQHAIQNELFGNRAVVLGKSAEDSTVVRFKSTAELTRILGIHQQALTDYLNSPLAGRVIHDGWVYKYDDDAPWPDNPQESGPHLHLNRSRSWVAVNQVENKEVFYNNLKSVCELIGLDMVRVKNHRARKGADVPYLGWIFLPLLDYIEDRKGGSR